MKVSFILPVLNEEKNLLKTLEQLQSFRQQGHEVIVADGGSHDDSFSLARLNADKVIVSEPGRAVQMNNGASVATGDVYLFLHADTQLPTDVLSLLKSLNKDCFWGFFAVQLSSRKTVFRVIERLISLRSRWSSIATGDQAIFIEKKLFNRIGGFPEIALMEDIAISRRLKALKKPVCFHSKVITSSRRWESRGVLSTVLLMWKLRLYYFIGVSPDKLVQLYR